MTIKTKTTCVECWRVFDLLNEDDVDEWFNGHDCEPHDCSLSFKHSDCSRIEDKGEFIGHVFKNSDGDWMYVDATETGPRGIALAAGTTNSRQSAINWLRLGRN